MNKAVPHGVWGGSGPYADRYAYHFDRQGNDLGNGFPLPGWPGSLHYDPAREAIWSKENSSTWLDLHSRDGAIVDQFAVGVTGEGVAQDPFDGTFWLLTKPQIHHVQRVGETGLLLGVYDNPSAYYPPDTLLGFFSAGEDEGIVVDQADRTLWFNADQYEHVVAEGTGFGS